MFIKLTNAAQNMKDTVLVLRKDIIVSVFESEVEWPAKQVGDNVVEMAQKDFVTVVFCGASGSWYAKESTEEIFNML